MIDLATLNAKNGTHTFLEELEKLHKKLTNPYRKDWRIGARRLQGHLEMEAGEDYDDKGLGKAPSFGGSSGIPSTRYASIIPLYYPQYMRVLGRVLETIKGFQCVSASNDSDDRTGTYAGEQLLKEYLADHSGQYFPEVVRMVAIVMATGCCPVLIEGVTDFGELEGEMIPVGGDVVVEANLPQDVWHLPNKDPRKSPAMALVQRKDRGWINKRWPTIEIPKDVSGAKWQNDAGLNSIMPAIEEALIEVKRLWVRKCKEYPEGLHRVVIDNKAVFDETLKTYDGEYPIEYIIDTPLGPSFYNRGRMAFMTPVQVVADEAWSKAVEIVRKHPGRTYFIPPGSDVKAEDITDKPVAVVEAATYNGQKIEWIDMPDVGHLVNFVSFCNQIMEEISSQHGPSKGQPVGSRTPAKAVESYIEQSEVADYTFNMLLRGSMSRIGKRILAEGQRVWGDEKIFYVLGKNRRYEAQTFKTANLQGEWDVRVTPDAGLPRSKQQRINLLTQALKAGGLGELNEMGLPSPQATRRFQELVNIDTDDQLFGNAVMDREIQKARLHFKKLQEAAKTATEMMLEEVPEEAIVQVGWEDDGETHVTIEKQMLAEAKNAALGGEEIPEIGMLDSLVGMHCAMHGDPAAMQAWMPKEYEAMQQAQMEQEMMMAGTHPSQQKETKPSEGE
jgi:hypothetical protein